MDIAHKKLQTSVLLLCSSLLSATVFAAGEVRHVETSTAPATPFRYTAQGNTHTWGAGHNVLIEAFSTDTDTFRFADSADRVELVRDDIANVSNGVPCGVFAERSGANASMLAADFPNDTAGTGNCDMAAMLASRVVNRGTLDIFSNSGPTPKNVERIDYLFDAGLFAGFSPEALHHTGHLVAEKRGNNRVQVAAILSLDVFGQPAEFGPLVRVHEFYHSDAADIRYGETNLRHNYSFFQSNSVTPQAFPVYLQDSTETVAMAFVQSAHLSLKPGQRYFGFSYFGDDVNPHIHALTDVSTYLNDTADNHIVVGDGADIYGGVSGMFVSDAISVGTGSVFLDENGDGAHGADEAGIGDITLDLYQDTDGNGQLDTSIDELLASFPSAGYGGIVLPGLPNGDYLLQLDNSDPDLPAGTTVPDSQNPVVFSIDNDDPDNLNFAVVDESLNYGSDGSDGSDGTDGTNGTNGSGDPIDEETASPGNMTDVVPDTAEVNQGSSVAIDVLANDIDASGLGLTITSIKGSDNATIAIENGQITYTPNFEFYGMDSFIYTITDGLGNQASGTVAVEVLRFSDINNNGINDFVECGCESLQLETGVHGSGLGGSLHWIALLVLSVFGIARRSARSFYCAKSGVRNS